MVWLGITVVTLWLDRPIAASLYTSGFYLVAKCSIIARVAKLPGTFCFILAIIVINLIYRAITIDKQLILLLASATSGLFYSVAKWVVGRGRPINDGVLNAHPFEIHAFEGGVTRLFVARSAESFPSGHASLAFATASVLGSCFPRGRIWFLFVEDAHYLSDVIAGAGLGMIAAACANQLYCNYRSTRRSSIV
jgi:membrane-associated phospholipid phosphatase